MKAITRSITMCLLIAAAAVMASAQAADAKQCAGANGLTSNEITELLTAQNRIRATAGLKPFTWNCELAALAQEWASKGVFAHRDDTQYGENLFVSSNGATSAVESIGRWLAEKEFWNADAAACQAGKVCTHYTQLVWGSTTEVGCGINRNGAVKWKLLLVCNYNPPGNVGP